ncbi:MAG: pyruvate kinase [Myxococcota bacterium]|jgi:pyruvate kinase|nr:pyruvate kinase [Myxococcota bacterium]
MRLRKTKLIATIGPACSDPDLLAGMIEAGMDVARFNLSHGNLEDHARLVDNVREVVQRVGANVATLVDTRGNEIRIGELSAGAVLLEIGSNFTLRTEPGLGDETGVSVSFEGLPKAVTKGDRVLIDDGKIELSVLRVRETSVECRVECGGSLRDRKGVNLPDTDLNQEVMDPGTQSDLEFAARCGTEYLAASFVQTARDVSDIRRFLEGENADIPIIAKIENRLGVDNLEEIIATANGTMVARGDLGVELPFAEIPHIQKRIIRSTVSGGKPVITATQMLDSMERNPRPTRAEVSDVANAILDGSSAVMLSGETAAGLHPVAAVETMARLAIEAEKSLEEFGTLQHVRPNASDAVVEAVAQAAITMANHLQAGAIIALTDTGFTARSISKLRPRSPILAVTRSHTVRRRLALNWGVMPIHYVGEGDDDTRVSFAVQRALKIGHLRTGDLVVATAGRSQQTGGTDMIQVLRV